MMIGISVLSMTGCGDAKGETKEPEQVNKQAAEKTDAEESNKDDMSGVTFEYTFLDDGTLSVWSYDAEKVPEIFEVPDEIDGQTVTEVRGSLFRMEDKVKKVILPATVTSIGDETFSLAESIEEIEIRGTVQSVGKRAFLVVKE